MSASRFFAGIGLLGFASVVAAQFFMVHGRFENAASVPYLIALALSELFLVGLGWRFLFFDSRSLNLIRAEGDTT